MTAFPDLLDALLAGEPMAEATARETMDAILTGDLGPERLAALVTALRSKPLTADELVGFARGMRDHALHIASPRPALDNCGTGGSPLKTFNISTATAFVLAGDGIMVAKHGNRSVTRPSGSADVLEQAGASLDLPPERVATILDEVGIAFLFAPTFHPAMRHAGPVRHALGVKTVFNLLGPLCNPAGATQQVLGVYDPDLVPLMASALGRLGCESGFVVHGLASGSGPDQAGFDEATPCGPVTYAAVREREATPVQVFDPAELGIERSTPEAIGAVAPDRAPATIRAILAGDDGGPRRDAVALNAALGLVAARRAPDLARGLDRARQLLDDGVGNAKWDAFVAAARP